MDFADNWLLCVAVSALVVGLLIYVSREETFELGHTLQHADCLWKNKRFLVLCNPVGGKRQGELIVRKVVQPMCAANSISVDVIYTERQKHASDIAANTDFSVYAGVLIVSGDGLIHEFLNGLAMRVRSSTTQGKKEEEEKFLSFLASFPPIGVLPGGTCNGVCTTLHSHNPVAAMEAIIKGKPHPVDIFHAMSPNMLSDNGNRCAEEKDMVIDAWDVHYFSWAIVADAGDIIERKVRFLPKALREPVAAVSLIAQKKVYRGTVYLQPSDSFLQMPEATRKELMYNDPLALPLATVEPYASLGYRVIEGTFALFCGANMSEASFDVRLAPSSRADDESIDIVFIKGDVSRFQLVSTFLSLDSGHHMKSDYVHAYKAKSFSLVPESGIVDISGELYTNPNVAAREDSSQNAGRLKAVTVTVHPKAVSFIY